jgi:hypothetical protein
MSRLLGKTVFNLCGGMIGYYNAGGSVVSHGVAVNKMHPGPDLIVSLLITRKNTFGLSESDEED